jgi:hypothetical protein
MVAGLGIRIKQQKTPKDLLNYANIRLICCGKVQEVLQEIVG